MFIDSLIKRYPTLKECAESIHLAYEEIIKTYENNGKLIICGNGGSCADAEHMVGELMKSFKKKRPISDELKERLLRTFPKDSYVLIHCLETPLPAISLTGENALNTAILNDTNSSVLYAQQLLGYAETQKDILIGFSTSGNAENIYNAFCLAKTLNIPTILFTGKNGGKIKSVADISICVPEEETYLIQEYHLPIYHALCLDIEDYFFS